MRSRGARRWKLGARAFVALATIAAVIPAVAGMWVVAHVQNVVSEGVESAQLATAATLGQQIEQGYRFAVDLARAAAHRPGLVLWVQEGDVARQRQVLGNTYETNDVLRRIALYDRAGRLSAWFPPSPEPARTIGGEPVPFITEARPSGNDAIVVVREPVTSPDHDRIGVIVAEVSLARIARVATLRFGRTGAATVVDQNGTVLVTGEPARVGTRLLAPELIRLLNGDDGTARYYSPALRRGEVAALWHTPGGKWSVLITQAQAEVFQPVRDLRSALLVAIAVTIAIGLALAIAAARTLTRYEQRLQAQLDEQHRLNRTLDEFSGRVAHDLRNPLASIVAGSQLAMRDPNLSDQSKKMLDIVLRQGRRASVLIEDLLHLARASGTPDRQPVDVIEIARELADEIRGVELNTDRASARVLADRIAVRQALTNLVQNAATHACLDGHVAVDLLVADDEHEWRIGVADRGPGVPEGERQRIFEAFERGTGTEGRAGTGLGLAIVSTVAEAHGGRAWYEPRDGGGSIFWFSLPRR